MAVVVVVVAVDVAASFVLLRPSPSPSLSHERRTAIVGWRVKRVDLTRASKIGNVFASQDKYLAAAAAASVMCHSDGRKQRLAAATL